MSAVFIILGVAVVVVAFGDVFQSVIIPRPTGRMLRPSALISRWGWESWRWAGHRIGNNERREDFLAAFAPVLLVGLQIFWVVMLVFGYGLMFYGLRDQLRPSPDFGTALYFAGTSLLTIGYGDIVPTGGAARFIALCAGTSGFGVVAILTTFLFSIFGAFQTREAFVVTFTNRAGAPPSAVEMLETHKRLDIINYLQDTMRESQLWIAQVMETHLAYPVLTYFRSTHDSISWIAVFGTILDASTLAITTLDIPTRGEALILNRLGRHFVSDFSQYFGFDGALDGGVERAEFDLAYDRLGAAGLPLRERENSWKQFSELRSTYAAQLNQMAQYWRIPPAQWVGDRSYIGSHQAVQLSDEVAALID
jgi:hypothetical protein